MGHPSFDKWIPLQYDNDNGIKTDEPHRCPNKPYYVSNKDTSRSTNILPMTESEAEVAAVLDAKVVAEDTISKEDRIIDMMNRMMIKLDRLLGLLEGKKDDNDNNNKDEIIYSLVLGI